MNRESYSLSLSLSGHSFLIQLTTKTIRHTDFYMLRGQQITGNCFRLAHLLKMFCIYEQVTSDDGGKYGRLVILFECLFSSSSFYMWTTSKNRSFLEYLVTRLLCLCDLLKAVKRRGQGLKTCMIMTKLSFLLWSAQKRSWQI